MDNQIINPLTGKPVSKERAEFIATLREARAGAKKAARSGNPAVAGPARKALVDIPGVIRATYMQDTR